MLASARRSSPARPSSGRVRTAGGRRLQGVEEVRRGRRLRQRAPSSSVGSRSRFTRPSLQFPHLETELIEPQLDLAPAIRVPRRTAAIALKSPRSWR